ncbi:MAG: hypothetical protein NTZ79_17140 [Proteobacteria bacterium]|nr:hypothetical protein [Pseudomonadota bacterium]
MNGIRGNPPAKAFVKLRQGTIAAFGFAVFPMTLLAVAENADSAPDLQEIIVSTTRVPDRRPTRVKSLLLPARIADGRWRTDASAR